MFSSTKIRLVLFISLLLLASVVIGILYLGTRPFHYDHRYNLAAIAQCKAATYREDNKVAAIIKLLPLPDQNFSLQANILPPNLRADLSIVYDSTINMDFPFMTHRDEVIQRRQEVAEMVSAKNALVLFVMIDDLQQVAITYMGVAARDVGMGYIYQRADFEARFGDLSVLANDLDQLEVILAGECRIGKPREFRINRFRQ